MRRHHEVLIRVEFEQSRQRLAIEEIDFVHLHRSGRDRGTSLRKEISPSSRPQSPEDVQSPNLVPGFQVSSTPGGNINLQPDAVLLQRCSRGLVPWRPTRSPVMASPTSGPTSSSSPSLKRRRSQRSLKFGRSRRPLTTAEIEAVIADSGSDIEESEGEDDATSEFMADVGEAVEGDETSLSFNVESMRQVVSDLRSEIIQVEEAEEEVQGNWGGGDGDSSQFSWSEDFSSFSGQKTEFRGSPGPTQISLDPVDIFEYFCGGDIISTIVEETTYRRKILSTVSISFLKQHWSRKTNTNI